VCSCLSVRRVVPPSAGRFFLLVESVRELECDSSFANSYPRSVPGEARISRCGSHDTLLFEDTGGGGHFSLSLGNCVVFRRVGRSVGRPDGLAGETRKSLGNCIGM